jgi:predicted metal-binding membrane protein
MTAPIFPLRRERFLIIGLLLGLASAAWLVLFHQADSGDDMMSLTMGMSAPLFLAIWIVMMVAMMFPTAAPMIVMFNTIANGKRERGQSFVPTWVFVSAYLVVWVLFGVMAYLVALVAEQMAQESMWLMDHAAEIGGGVLILAGIYQLSPLKSACLAKCRSPFAFIFNSWRDGYSGAFRMGIDHGSYCLGCCWLLFMLLFPLGIMNVAAMALITLLIFAEKSLPAGDRIGQLAALGLIAYGIAVLVDPGTLPTTMWSEPPFDVGSWSKASVVAVSGSSR